MRVIMLNGSRHFDGTTAQALQVIGQQLQQNNIEVVTVQLDSVSGYRDCDGCNQCKPTGHCRHEDIVNDIIDLLQEADGLILASPTHFGGITGSMKVVLDRLWYAPLLWLFAVVPALSTPGTSSATIWAAPICCTWAVNTGLFFTAKRQPTPLWTKRDYRLCKF